MHAGPTDKKVWFITGAGRGMGVDIARAALAAGHAVVANGRKPDKVTAAVGEHDDLLADITDPADAGAVRAALGRFGRVDVLVNNAGNFYAGFFEEVPADDFRAQIETNLFGPVNVTRAVLPVMSAQRDGLIVTISSTAGIVGQAFVSAYSASKFGLEGWMESLTPEVAPFGIRTMLDEPPLRWAAGADAADAVEHKARTMLAQVDAYRELSSSLAHDDTAAIGTA